MDNIDLLALKELGAGGMLGAGVISLLYLILVQIKPSYTDRLNRYEVTLKNVSYVGAMLGGALQWIFFSA